MSSPPPPAVTADPEPTHGVWSRAFQLAIPHGIVVGIQLPTEPGPIPHEVSQRLHPKERAAGLELSGARQIQWTGGRLALQLALKRLRSRRQPFLSQPSGAVQAPQGLFASVSHKRDLAVGLVGQEAAGSLGVDVETVIPERNHLAPRILTPGELQRWQALPEDRRWPVLLTHFSIKESIYKALHPMVDRYVGFHEAELDLGPNGSAQVTLHLTQGEGPFEVQARYLWLDQHLLTTARIRKVQPPPSR